MLVISDLGRVGIEIRRRESESWRDLVSRYAALKDRVSPCIIKFDELVTAGFAEPWAALKALDEHGCTDVIVDTQHIDARVIGSN